MAPKVLFVDDEDHLRNAAEQTFDLAGIDFESFAEAEPVLDKISQCFDGVIVSDIRMRGMDGLALMRRVLDIDPTLPIILITGHGDIDLAVTCIKDGAYDFIEKPFDPSRLVASVRRALDARRLTLENRDLRRQFGSSDVVEAALVGRSRPTTRLHDQIRAIAATDADVLIVGQTGSGKEIAARALHRISERAEEKFVRINCAALPEATMETELFGHEAGAFPGATRARMGKLEHARGGILCLDEIDSMPQHLQAKLLDVLHNRTVTRQGSHHAIELDIRVIALAKSDLEAAVEKGRFRADLYYRLNVITIRIPSLDERRDDIPRLFPVLVAEAGARYKVTPPDIPGDLLAALAVRNWPGNVRELRNAAERFALGLQTTPEREKSADETLAALMDAHEKALISAAISAHDGRIKDVYESLGIGRKTLYNKMQKHGLSREGFSFDD
ncbi:sigma-54-dependent transcriptional regulator [Thalassococcus sp. BH17M4-6]|uniref:sigma-54-dependent transcriptional regulator n=1 Tax=Thalassococcus sp. BH17M4-6 TaxID=3413148 RepID=UPI003BE1C6F8